MTFLTFPKPIILVDMDGVLAWWEKRFISEMKLRHPHVKVWEFGIRTEADQPKVNVIYDLPETQDVLRTPRFYRNLDPVEGGKKALEEMRDADYDVFICTSPSIRNITCASDKFEWVAEHLGAEWAHRTIITKRKDLVRGDILIDDKPYIEHAELASWSHVRFDQSYNRGDMTRPRMVGWSDWRRALQDAMHVEA